MDNKLKNNKKGARQEDKSKESKYKRKIKDVFYDMLAEFKDKELYNEKFKLVSDGLPDIG